MALPPPSVPVVIGGRYRLSGLLGRGGMADVHAAVDERDGSWVAVKLFRAPLDGVRTAASATARRGPSPDCATPASSSCSTWARTRAGRTAS